MLLSQVEKRDSGQEQMSFEIAPFKVRRTISDIIEKV